MVATMKAASAPMIPSTKPFPRRPAGPVSTEAPSAGLRSLGAGSGPMPPPAAVMSRPTCVELVALDCRSSASGVDQGLAGPATRSSATDGGRGPLGLPGPGLHELTIAIICANSPQAKGRVERAHKTLQDRLVKELRLAGVS